ncbi:phosphoribosylformylglycinamidine cyclo-ligase [bacterium]|nr:phosphoribosylformylglycinamidine cyclo-ligase [bacterium]
MKYADSGVNIDAATRALARAKDAVRSTWDARVKSDVGAFGGLYQPAPGEPYLVASVDGVGTKVMLAVACGRFDTVGQDLVNHCVDDILVQGAEPLFFLDYFATGTLSEDVLPGVLAGFAQACRENGCALLGGETAEMPGVYREGEFDLAGTIVGRVAPEHVIDGSAIGAGDRVWGLPSTGLHTNGYSLARKVLLETAGLGLDDRPEGLGTSLGDALLAVHRSYLEDVRRIWEAHGRQAIHGLVHVTGGGFFDNVPRIVPDGLCAVIDTAAWPVPRLFALIAEHGEVEPAEMYRVFNMGIGLAVITPPTVDLAPLVTGARLIGEVARGDRRVDVRL